MRVNPRIVALAAIAILAPILSQWAIRSLPPLHRAELLIYDWHAGELPRLPPDDRIVLVGMDAGSLANLPLDRPAYPLPRSIHAAVVRELHAAGAAVIAFDVIFTRSVPAEDEIFAGALKDAHLVLTGTEPSVTIVDGAEEVTFTKASPALRPYLTACSILAPAILGKFRWFQPFAVDANTTERYPHLIVKLAEALGGSAANAPLGGDGEILIRFAGPANTFTPLPISTVYDGSWRQLKGPDFFRGKAVLVGAIDPFVDRALTPTGNIQGVEVLAQAAQAVLQGNWIRHWTEAGNFALIVALCLALGAAVWRFGSRWGLAVLLVLSASWVLFAHWLFVHQQIWADTLGPVAALVLTLAFAGAYEAARVSQVFRRFMPSRVADRMLDASPSEAASANEVGATIAFCDVRKSTTLAETLPPAQMEALMRRYFTCAEDAAHRHGTELDKFVGDEIMLYFEDRPGLEPHALRAVRWAFDLQAACEAITASGSAGDIGFRVGVGICSGRVRIGTVGAKQRIQHTVMGDAVNTASRLQAMTKEMGQSILVSETTWDTVSRWVEGSALGAVEIRGKDKPLAIYAPARLR